MTSFHYEKSVYRRTLPHNQDTSVNTSLLGLDASFFALSGPWGPVCFLLPPAHRLQITEEPHIQMRKYVIINSRRSPPHLKEGEQPSNLRVPPSSLEHPRL